MGHKTLEARLEGAIAALGNPPTLGGNGPITDSERECMRRLAHADAVGLALWAALRDLHTAVGEWLVADNAGVIVDNAEYQRLYARMERSHAAAFDALKGVEA